MKLGKNIRGLHRDNENGREKDGLLSKRNDYINEHFDQVLKPFSSNFNVGRVK